MKNLLNKKSLAVCSCFFFLSFFSACSIFNNSNLDNSAQNANDAQNVQTNTDANDISQNDQNFFKQGYNNIQNLSDIEILWLIPQEQTEGFILSYGFDENNITNKVQIFSNELEKVADPVYNQVYRYVLKNVPKDKIIFLQLVAFNENQFSSPSKIFTLRAN